MFLKENAWWIGLILAVIGVIASLYPVQIKFVLGKVILFAVTPTGIIIIFLNKSIAYDIL